LGWFSNHKSQITNYLRSLQTSASCRFQQRVRIHFGIAFAEYGVASHQNLGSGSHDGGYRIQGYASIYFDAELVTLLGTNFG
jgi:hypothetical protein